MNPAIFPASNGGSFIQKRAEPTTTTTAEVSTTKKATATTTTAKAAETTVSATSSISFANNATQSVSFPNPTTSASITRTSSPTYYSLTNLIPTTTDPSATATDSLARSATDLPAIANSTADAASESFISSGSIAGIIVGVFVAAAVGLSAILFIKRKGTGGTRRQKDTGYSHRVSFFGQNEFFAGPSVPPPSMKSTPKTYGAAAAPTAAAADPSSYYYNQQRYPTYMPQHHSPQLYTTAPAGPSYTQQQQHSISSPPGPPRPSDDPWIHPPLGCYTVTSTYTPTLDDEVYVYPGDQVQVYTEYDDGWCLGVNISRGNARGVFPKHCLLPSSPSGTNSSAGFGISNLSLNKHLSKRGSSMYGSSD